MKIKLRGIHRLERRLANGTLKTYYRLGRGKGSVPLVGEPGSAQFLESYRAATEARKTDDRTTSALIDAYLDSGHFKHKLAKRTQEDYRKLAAKFREKFGSASIRFWKDPRMKAKLRKWHDSLADSSPRQADYMWTLMSSVFKLAIRDGLLVTNPCAGGEMLYSGSRIDVIWSSTQVGAFLAQRKYAFMHLPLLIGLWTGQREGDVLRMKWADYDGQTIKVKQRKGRRRRKQGSASIVVIRVAGPLKAVLDAEAAARRAAKVSPLKIEMQNICLTSEGEAWQEGKSGYTGFIHVWSEARKEAKIEGVKFGDLRGTAVTRLALAGCTVPEICAITGHTHKDANRILEAHYLHRDPEIAWNAIRKLAAYQVREEKPAEPVAEPVAACGKSHRP
jgi:integrase